MNWAHVHLLINNVPILGSFFAALFFAVAATRNSRDAWAGAGMVMLGIASLGALLAFLTGEPAAEVIKGQANTSGSALSEHHVRGVVAISTAGIAALIGVVALIRVRKRGGSYSRHLVTVLLVATLASAAAFSWTGLAGGRVSHPELQRPGDRDAGPAHSH
jgi:uncharacterized membrane protein